MSWTFRIARMTGMLLAATAVSAAEPILTSYPGAEIQVRIYDYAGVSPKTLARAKAVASEALGAAGAHLVWADCRLRAEDPIKDQACEQPLSPTALHLRLIDKKMAEAARTRNCLGFARHIDGFDWLAAAYVHQAEEMEKRNTAPRAVALGGIMAHEIRVG